MKLIIKTFLFAFLAIGLLSCEDELDLSPEQDLSPEDAFQNQLASEASLTGAYGRLISLDVFGSMPQIIGDFQADNVNFIGSFPTLQAIRQSSVAADNATIRTIFRDHYRAILASNAVIVRVPEVEDPGFSEEDRNQMVAEAKFIRALLNFNLVNLFAHPYSLDDGASPGIGLITTPGVLDGDYTVPDRSTVAEVYDAIEADLLDALPDLPSVNGRVRASTGAANALLSRLYLYKGDNTAAAERAQMVIDEGNYSLASGYDFYNSLTSETILDVAMSAIDNSRTGSGGWAEFYNPAEAGARGDCPFSTDLLETFEEEPGDLRFLEQHQYNEDSSLVYTTKFPNVQTNEDNAPLIRITEVYLNRAEALAKESNSVEAEALSIVNMLRDRAGLDAYEADDFASPDEFIDAILTERRKELCFEGHRRMDLLRNGEVLNIEIQAGAINIVEPGDNQAVMPIPVREIDLGSSLPQNPGY